MAKRTSAKWLAANLARSKAQKRIWRRKRRFAAKAAAAAAAAPVVTGKTTRRKKTAPAPTVGIEDIIRQIDDVKAQLAPPPFIWKTADGRQIPTHDMSDEHLRNTISYIQRRMAYMFGHARFLSDLTMLAHAFPAMLDEAGRRGFSV